MAIVGHGIDLVDIDDFRRLLARYETHFLARCFTSTEIDALNLTGDKCQAIAGRFAAKEATLKALGTGFGGGISFKHVEVTRTPGNPPEAEFLGPAGKAALNLGVTKVFLSVTHTSTHAFASAILVND